MVCPCSCIEVPISMTVNLQVLGLIRFSLLSPTFYSRQFATIEDTAAYLFDTDRLELRLRLFADLCLRSLVRQSDPDFQLVVVTSKRLPKPFMTRLQDLLDPHPNIHLRAYAPNNHFRLLQRGYDSISTGAATHQALFRLDDDDGLDLDFIQRTRRLAHGLIPLQSDDAPFALSGNRGFYAVRDGEDVSVYDAIEPTPLSTGTTVVCQVGKKANPYRYNHRKFGQHYNMFSDISVPTFVRTNHGDNKSSVVQLGKQSQLEPEQIRAQLLTHFDLTPEALTDLLL